MINESITLFQILYKPFPKTLTIEPLPDRNLSKQKNCEPIFQFLFLENVFLQFFCVPCDMAIRLLNFDSKSKR